MTNQNLKIEKCQNCNNEFMIEPEDFEFYNKIQVPSPTFCPDCRIQRRLAFINESKFYFRSCDLCKKRIVSIYHKYSPYTVYCVKCWWSDKWDAMKYGVDYDFEKPFLEQYNKLTKITPKIAIFGVNSIDCDYAQAYNSKNCYLSSVNWSENCAYTIGSKCRDSFDTYGCLNIENCYECIYCNNSYKCFFSIFVLNCINSSFIYDSNNLSDCFLCVNLRNKQYYIFNKKYSKEEYDKELKKYDTGSYKNLVKIKNKFLDFKLKFPHRYSYKRNSINSTGDNLENVNNCYHCFFCRKGLENSKYISLGGFMLKDSYDITNGGGNSSLLYESALAGNNLSKSSFLISVLDGISIYYSIECYSSKNIFGCVSLRNKEYCVLNKQYTKEEYEELVLKIIEHMGTSNVF